MQPPPPDYAEARFAGLYRLLGVALYVLTIIFTYWLCRLHDQGADLNQALLPALGAIAAPLFAIGMAATAPDYYCLGPSDEGSDQFQLGWVVLIPGYALHLILRGQFELVSWETLVFIGLVGGFVLACVISRSRFKLLEFVGIMGFSGAYVGGAVLFFNCMFDPNPVETVTQRNRDPRYGPGVFIVNFKDARTHGVSQLFLKSFHFRDTSEGICVRVHRGSLFLSWYTVDPYRDCPGATAALAALKLRHEQLCAAGNAQACAAIAQDKSRRQARNFRPENTPEMRCFNGDNVQCQRLCDRGKKYLSCANQDWLIMDPAWTVKAWTQGANADGRYVANVMVSCKTPLETLAPSPSSPAQNTVEFDGVQFRGPTSKRLYNTMAEALSEVCVTARALRPGGQVSGGQATRPDSRDRYIKVPHRAERPSVHKCKSPDGKLIFTDTACPE